MVSAVYTLRGIDVQDEGTMYVVFVFLCFLNFVFFGWKTTLSDFGIDTSGLVAAAVGSTASDTRADEPLLLSIIGRAHLIGHLISICEVVAQQLPIEEAQP